MRNLARDRVQDGRFLRLAGENNEPGNQISRSDAINTSPRLQRNRSLFLVKDF